MNANPSPAFRSGFGGQVRGALEGLDELRPAVRVARIVDSVDPQENVRGFQRFRPGQRAGQEDGVARRDVSHRDSFAHRFHAAALWNRDVIRQGRTAEGAQVDLQGHVPRGAKSLGNSRGRIDLDPVPLAVVEGKGVALEALLARQCQAGR